MLTGACNKVCGCICAVPGELLGWKKSRLFIFVAICECVITDRRAEELTDESKSSGLSCYVWLPLILPGTRVPTQRDRWIHFLKNKLIISWRINCAEREKLLCHLKSFQKLISATCCINRYLNNTKPLPETWFIYLSGLLAKCVSEWQRLTNSQMTR